MAVQDIVNDIASVGGIDLTSQDQLTFTISRVDQAARELYDQNDLIGSLREQVFNAAVQSGMQVSLPNYVGRVRACRYYFPELNLQTVDMRPRYAARFWQSKNLLSWRLKTDQALLSDISNTGIMGIAFKDASTVDVNITIIGSGDFADHQAETLLIKAGTNAVNTFNSYNKIETFAKDVETMQNCYMVDSSGKLVSYIPNNQKRALFAMVQIINLPNRVNQTTFAPVTNFVEVLWKIRYKPLVNMTDEFVVPGYERAIFWKYLELQARLMTTPDLNAAAAHGAQADKIVKDVANDSDQSIEKTLNFGTNATYDAFETMTSDALLRFYPNNFVTAGCSYVWP